jgi:uncharacterized protein YeaO (DUF488 family)
MSIRTKRWNDPPDPDDGFRLLVCRYRPRGVSKQRETWDEWWPDLGPSRALHAAYWGKTGEPLGWEAYRLGYLEDIERQRFRLRALAGRHQSGETITLLCSSACGDETRCHRTILADLIGTMALRDPV